MEYAVSVIKNVLGALYQTGGASLIIAALFMSVYMRIKKKGTGAVIQAWISEFRSSSQFRREFLLVFYVYDAVQNPAVQTDLGKSPGQRYGNLGYS